MDCESAPLLPPKGPPLAKTSPEEYRGCGATFFFSWLSPIMELGASRPLDFDDLYVLNQRNRANTISLRFDHFWTLQLRSPQPSLPWALGGAFGSRFMIAGLLRFVRATLEFVAPFVLKRMIAFVRTPDAPVTEGWLLAAAIFASGLLQSFCFRQFAFIINETSMQIRSAVISKVHAKTLRLSTKALQERSTGEIANLVSIDAARLHRVVTDLHSLWMVPYLLVVA
ncbi:ATP-binding Cassette (ABC) Superfamily, partial [Achlya hypogyna]